MKIAYILPIDTKKYDGVLNKVRSQVEAWVRQGEDVKIFLIARHQSHNIESTSLAPLFSKGIVAVYCSKETGNLPIDLFKDWVGLKSVFSDVLSDLELLSPDIVYARNSLFQPFYKNIGKNFKLVLELNTDMSTEYKLQAWDSTKYFLRYLYYLLTNRHLLSGVSGLASVTHEIAAQYTNIPVKVFPNSISIDNYPQIQQNSSGNLGLLFIGSPGMPWHGVDILIDLANELGEVHFDVIGISKTEFPKAPENIEFHGYLSKENYLKLFSKTTAAIASLAFYRNKMEEACPLKVREYLACCKPVILPYMDTAFEEKGYPEWVLQLPNNRQGILDSVNEIREFLDNCSRFNITKDDVRKYVDVSVIEKERVEFFRTISI